MFNLSTILPFINKNSLYTFFLKKGLLLEKNDIDVLYNYITKNSNYINKNTLITHIYNNELSISKDKKDQIYYILINTI